MSVRITKKRKYTRSTRAKDKILVGVPLDFPAPWIAQGNYRVYDSIISPVGSLPFTITGLRWEVNIIGTNWATGQLCNVVWVIAKVPNGTTLAQKAQNWPDFQKIYDPEEDVLAWGTTMLGADTPFRQKSFQGHTKSMRKMKGGDSLGLFVLASVNLIDTSTSESNKFSVMIKSTFQWFQLS